MRKREWEEDDGGLVEAKEKGGVRSEKLKNKNKLI